MLDRGLQRRLLERMRETYPEDVNLANFEAGTTKRAVTVNVFYLYEHGLIGSKPVNLLDGGPTIYSAKITAKGLDFLEQDGGLSAILGILTVRLHDETIRQFLLAKVETLDAPVEVKAELADVIKTLPAKSIEVVALDLVKDGLEHVPNAVRYLMQLLGPG